jgi:hypothetical protein
MSIAENRGEESFLDGVVSEGEDGFLGGSKEKVLYNKSAMYFIGSQPQIPYDP